MSVPQPGERVHGLDAVRGLALLLGVVLHATMSFFPGPRVWVVADADRSITLSVTFFLIHVMRMTVFFLIAGFFGRMLYHKSGWKGFVANRLQRIGLPLVIGWPIILIAIGMVMAAAARAAGVAPQGSAWPDLSARSFPLTHLWFLYLLLILYAMMLPLRGMLALLDGKERVRRAVDMGVRGLLGPWAALLLAVPVAIGLYRHPYWIMWFGIPTPDSSLYPNTAALLTYGTGFALGWLVHRQMTPLLARWERQWPWHLALACVASVACLLMVGPQPLLMPVPQGSRKLWYAVSYAVALWSWTFALLGMGLRFFGGYSPVRRYLADASYWIYLVHLPLVMALQLVVSRWGLPWQLKLPLILAVTLALLLLSYRYLVRPTVIGAVLNGRRYPRSATPPRTQGSPVMRTLLLALLFPATLIGQTASPAAPAPLPLETVLARHAAAVGPTAGIRTRRTTVRATGLAPFDLPIVVEAMRPNLIRKEVNLQGSILITAYDGSDGWKIDPFVAGGAKPTDLPAAELADLLEEADFDGPLFDAAGKGHRISYLGPAVVGVGARRVPVHSLKVMLKGGRESVIHLDASSYLEVKRVQTRPVMGSDMELEIMTSDYRKVAGIQVPHLIEILAKGAPQPARLIVERIELSVELDRRRFSRSGG